LKVMARGEMAATQGRTAPTLKRSTFGMV